MSDELRIPIHEELRLTARDHFDKGQFNLAVIEMNIAFESLTAEILRSRLKETGLSDRDVEKRMDRYLPSSMHQLLDKVLHRKGQTRSEELGSSIHKGPASW